MTSRTLVPQLIADSSTTIQRVRELPIPGEIFVNVGHVVACTDVIGEADLPGDLAILRIAEQMGLEPDDVLANIKVKEGDDILSQQILFEHKALFGLFSSKFVSPVDGRVEFISSSTGHIGIRSESKKIELSAYISGKVVEVKEKLSVVLETRGALVQGIFGVGSEQQGKLIALDIPREKKIETHDIPSASSGAILVGGATITIEALQRASQMGIRGVVTGSIDDTTLKELLGKDLGIALTGNEDIPLTVIITEGFGLLPMSERVYSLLKKFSGKIASINGATQVRAGAIRPEIIVTHEDFISENAKPHASGFVVGHRVRIIRVPFFGELGVIKEIPSEPQKLESGAVARVVKVEVKDRGIVMIPRANLELV